MEPPITAELLTLDRKSIGVFEAKTWSGLVLILRQHMVDGMMYRVLVSGSRLVVDRAGLLSVYYHDRRFCSRSGEMVKQTFYSYADPDFTIYANKNCVIGFGAPQFLCGKLNSDSDGITFKIVDACDPFSEVVLCWFNDGFTRIYEYNNNIYTTASTERHFIFNMFETPASEDIVKMIRIHKGLK